MMVQPNPFVGLRAFESDESLLFFGRQQQTLELLQHLHEQHFVAIVGSSGCGKSSLIRAGLIPGLKAGYLIEDRDKWLLCVMKPGQSPLYNLAHALVCETNPQNTEADIQQLLTAINEEGAEAVTDYLFSAVSNHHNIFLLVDQFEELFRFTTERQDADKKNEAIDFVNIILSLTKQTELPVYVVITMRSDFIGDCAQFYGLPEAMNKSQYLVPRLNRVQLKNVITGPIAVCGAQIDGTLLNKLLNDAGDNPDQLPVLQHVLMRTWDVWKNRNTNEPVSVADYQQTGTISSALSLHAEEAYAELKTNKLKRTCELLFKAITDKKLNARGVRRPQTFADLLLLTGAGTEELSEVIDCFRTRGRTFLMPPANVSLTSRSMIDISHESLMRVWTRLINWVEEESESEQIYTRLSEAAILYNANKGGLWRNPELDIALQWKEQSQPNAVWAGQINPHFTDAMHFLMLSKQKAEQEAQDKEKEQSSRLKRARSFAAIIGAVAFISILLMIYAFNQQKEANRQKKEATRQKVKAENNAHIALTKELEANSMKQKAYEASREAEKKATEARLSERRAVMQRKRADSLVTVANNALARSKQSEGDAVKAQQEALESKQSTFDMYQMVLDEAEKAKKSAKDAERSVKTADSLAAIADSRQYANKAMQELAAGNKTNARFFADTAYRLNADNHGPVQTSYIFNALHQYWTYSIHQQNEVQAFKEPATSVVAIGYNKAVVVNKNGTISLHTFTNNKLTTLYTLKYKGAIVGMATSPNEKQLAVITAAGKGTVYTIEPSGTLSSPLSFRFDGSGKSVLFTSNRSFAVLSDKGINLYGTATSVSDEGFTRGTFTAMALAAPNVLYITDARSMYVFNNATDLLSNKPSSVTALSIDFIETSNYVTCLAVNDSGNYVAAGTANGKIQLLKKEGNNWKRLSPLVYHQSAITAVDFAYVSGNRLQLASASTDETVKLIDVKTFISTADTDIGKATRVSLKAHLKLQNSEEIITLQGHGKSVCGIAYSKNGSLLFSCGNDGKLMAWKPAMSDLFNSVMWDMQAQAAE